jgi:N-methylhydantoinase A/oxoprolinase/acetone carboxylase beta subunit
MVTTARALRRVGIDIGGTFTDLRSAPQTRKPA